MTGKVTYNGEPLRFGTAICEPESGQCVTGEIQPDGTFQMETRGEGRGAPVGTCRVRFVCFPNQDPAAKPGKPKRGLMQGEGLAMGASLIPEKYLSCDTSGIVVNVKLDNNESFIFSLTSQQVSLFVTLSVEAHHRSTP